MHSEARSISYTEMPLSHKVQEIAGALSIYINQLVYDLKRMQRDIITLSLGESFFEIPYFDFRQLDFNRGYHYSDTRGIPALREKIAHYYNNRYHARVSADDVMISAGSKAIIYIAMQALINPGEEVIIHEPAWLSYKEQAHLVGATVRFIPFDHSCDQFSEHFSDKTRMLILNNPNNPAGRTYSCEELLDIYYQCRRRNICLLIDEAYSDFVLDNSFFSMTNLIPNLDGIIITNSLSKNMGMSGWRIGYALAEKKVLDAMLKLNQHLITCAPTILQLYLAEYFDNILGYTLSQVKEVVEKRKRIAKRMDELGISYLPGSTTFYFFIKTGDYAGNIHDLALYLLLEKGISVVPGSAYGNTTSNFLRMSIGTESEERIDQALLILRDTLSAHPIDSVRTHAELARLNLPEFE
ncbi:MAG: hypothetical protein ACD_46C00181G0040 [uncultured bacterium]|nr:MAG: hypothetical protein ACD_46C00181G0040 [uncultured bacterium]